jgi:hypothetical protein
VRSDAFFGGYGYFHPGRFDQRGAMVGVRKDGGADFDVVRIEPLGGEPRDLWFDRRTGLLALIVDETGPRQSRTELSDYRRVGGLLLPFQTLTWGGNRAVSESLVLETIEIVAVDRGLFSLPRPPESQAPPM